MLPLCLLRVILPMLRPSIQVALILRTVLAFQAFAVVVALGGATEAAIWSNLEVVEDPEALKRLIGQTIIAAFDELKWQGVHEIRHRQRGAFGDRASQHDTAPELLSLGFLVGGADVVGDRDGKRRRGVILGHDHPQAVLQFDVGELDLGPLGGEGRHKHKGEEREPEGPADQPWIQALEPEYVDTSELQRTFRGFLFMRIVPILKDIGLFVGEARNLGLSGNQIQEVRHRRF